MRKMIYCYVLVFLIIACSRELIIEEYSGHMDPSYRVHKIDSIIVKQSLYKTYFTANYSYNKREFDSIVQEMMCQAVNDSLPVTDFEFVFLDGLSKDWNEFLVSYRWNVKTPKELNCLWGKSPTRIRKTVLFNCELYKN